MTCKNIGSGKGGGEVSWGSQMMINNGTRVVEELEIGFEVSSSPPPPDEGTEVGYKEGRAEGE